MNAYTVGGKVGTAGAWVLSKSFHVGCKLASSAGSFGEGVMDIGGEKLTEYNTVHEAKRVQDEITMKARMAEIRAAHAAKMLALAAPVPSVPSAPGTMAPA